MSPKFPVKKSVLITLIALASIFGVSSCSTTQPVPATLVITNANIWTGNPEQPRAEALAVRGDSIIFVGEQTGVAALTGEATQVVDAQGGMVTPGFNDSHLHFIDAGLELSSVQLRDAATPAEFTEKLADFVRTVPAGTWITGGNWEHKQWGGELPDRAWIDAVTPDHPVWVSRLDGHMALANSKAIALAGVAADVADVAGGTIVRDAQGRLTGIFKDNAMDLINHAIPAPTDDQLDGGLDAAMDYVLSRGVTSVQHMGGWGDVAVFERAHRNDRLKVRISAAVPLSTWQALGQRVSEQGVGDEWLRVAGLKGFVDGSLGSHTAAFLQPYTDVPTDSGLLVNTEMDLYQWISGADSLGLQVMVHAIGDRANRVILDIFERVAQENGPRDRRFRVEHAQHIHPLDIPRFGQLGVIASMQPYHCIDDGCWAEPVIGAERSATTYAFRDLLDTGARLAFGSDWFVAPPTPLEGIYAAVTRRTLDDKHPDGWVPAQKISVEEALRAYTDHAAYAEFMDGKKGVLAVGKLADMVILDADLTRLSPEKIRDARVLYTIVGGKILYTNPLMTK
ncbi:MAG: amidohydrolase [Lentisphaeria bacterium]|nr:amidohydrolase [Candidatus Neomarinimicrobiota bacterium]MCF7841467.1 amidohydrolase [Lentisphaeria bacterium]